MPPTRTTTPEGDASLAEFVRRLKPEPRAAFLALRALAMSLGPEVNEVVADDGIDYSRRHKPFLRIEQQRNRLIATFPEAMPLSDPMGRLLRRGAQRYVRLDTAEDVDGHVQEFVRRAHVLAEA